MFGSSIKASKHTGVPSQTIRGWTKTEWWGTMVAEVRKRHQDRLDGKYTGLIDTVTSEIQERLDKGDEVVHAKTGEMLRKKVSARDCGDLLNKIQTLRSLMRGEPTSRSEKVTVDKKLAEIQEKLHEAGKASIPSKGEEAVTRH